MVEDNQLITQLRELIASSSVYRKRVEVDLFRSEEKYRQLLDQLSDAIYLSTVSGKFETFNKATSELLGYSAEELKTLDVVKIYANPADREVFTNHIRNKKEVRDYEVQLRHKDGHPIDCLVSSTVKYGDDGAILGFQGIIRDITLHKKNEELERAKLLAERANKFKAEFLANMSHEIRTPLNAIVGMVHLLDQTSLNEKQKEFLKAIKTSSGSLLEIINDILDFSKIESGKIELEEKTFSIRNSVKELIGTIQYKAEEKGLDLVVNIDDNIPLTVAGDPLRLNQILLNLLSNAIKFTQEGEVRLTIKLIEVLGDKARIFFSVRDTGIGIAAEKLSTIFESFTQATSDTTRLYGGTGLGLSIVKKLIDMLNGAIMVKSKLNEGSEFIFEIDFKIVGDSSFKEESNHFNTVEIQELRNCRFLLVEDHPLNQLVTSEMIKSHWPECVVEIAGNGKIALDMFENNDYDLIFMDVQMPEMNGHEATRLIRKTFGEPKASIPILAFTAYATTGEAEKCLEAGMNDFISKPVEPEALLRKVLKLLRKSPGFSNENMSAPVQDTADSQKTINLEYFNTVTMDDNELRIKMLRIMLDETPQELLKLQQFCFESNWEGVRAIAHKMKSTMQFIGLAETLLAVKEIEINAREGKSLDAIPEKIKTVVADTNSAMKQLEIELERISS